MSRLVYILSASHSGSTLLALLLGSHPDVCTVGELKSTALGDPAKYRCSCGEPIRTCGFWSAVSAAMERRGVPYEVTDARTDVRAGASPYARWLLKPLHRGPVLEAIRDAGLALSPSFRERLRDAQRRNRALVESLSEVTGKRVVVDSSKIGVRLKYLLRDRGLDVKVVRLVRDGRGVALTYMDPAGFADAARPDLRGGGSGAHRDDERLSMEEAAREWRRSNEEAESILAGLDPSRWIDVRYEDVCADPAAALRRLHAFAGVAPLEGGLPDFRAASPHVVGNGMRLDSTREIRRDERWREALSPADLAKFEEVAGDMNRRYGYV